VVVEVVQVVVVGAVGVGVGLVRDPVLVLEGRAVAVPGLEEA